MTQLGTQALATLACPRCGGTPQPDGGPGQLARCGACGVLGRIVDPEGQNRLVVRPQLDEPAALTALSSHLQERSGGAPRLHGAELVYAPYWRIETVLAGRLTGSRQTEVRSIERQLDDQGRSFYVSQVAAGPAEPVATTVQRVHIALVSACPLEELGLPALDRRQQGARGHALRKVLELADDTAVFDPVLRQSATVLDPLVRRDAALEEAQALLQTLRAGLSAGLQAGAHIELVPLNQSVALVFYPIWLVRAQSGAAAGEATIDAVRGEVIAVSFAPDAAESRYERRLWSLIALGGGAVAGAVLRELGTALGRGLLPLAGIIAAILALRALGRRLNPDEDESIDLLAVAWSVVRKLVR